jgi:acetate kinase
MSILVINAGSTSLKFGLCDDSPARILVIRTREDLMIAREVRRMAGS